MKKAQRTAERLQNVLMQDRFLQGADSMAMLRSDLTNLLGDYFDLNRSSLSVTVNPVKDGSYRVTIEATAVRVYR